MELYMHLMHVDIARLLGPIDRLNYKIIYRITELLQFLNILMIYSLLIISLSVDLSGREFIYLYM